LTQSTTRRPYPSAACSQAKSLRAKRDRAAAESALAVMKEAAAGDTNLMRRSSAAAKAHVTMGEIATRSVRSGACGAKPGLLTMPK
jgi:methylmalonyl-CoA mutase N-terminal domain/subunit